MGRAQIQLHTWADEDWKSRILRLASKHGFSGASLERAPDGKPFLQGAQNFFFNVSTTRGRTIAATAGIPVGIDWEHTGRQASCARIARRYFSEAECDWMESAGLAEIPRRFFSLWTAKEAGVKLDGCGLYTGGLCNCRIRIDPSKSSSIPMGGSLNGRDFHIRQLHLKEGFIVTVAAYVDFQLALPLEFSIVDSIR